MGPKLLSFTMTSLFCSEGAFQRVSTSMHRTTHIAIYVAFACNYITIKSCTSLRRLNLDMAPAFEYGVNFMRKILSQVEYTNVDAMTLTFDGAVMKSNLYQQQRFQRDLTHFE